jgi:hypothetical protein
MSALRLLRPSFSSWAFSSSSLLPLFRLFRARESLPRRRTRRPRACQPCLLRRSCSRLLRPSASLSLTVIKKHTFEVFDAVLDGLDVLVGGDCNHPSAAPNTHTAIGVQVVIHSQQKF